MYINYFYINKNIDNYNIIKFLAEVICFTYINYISIEEIILINKLIDISIELLKTSPNKFKYCFPRWRFFSWKINIELYI